MLISIALKEFQKNEYKNFVLAEFKKLANLSFDGNVKAAYKPALAAIDAPKKEILGAVKKTMMMGAVEQWIQKNPDGQATDFPRPMPAEQFNELKNNNIFANIFSDSNRTTFPSLDDIIKENVINYDFGILNYNFSTYKKHIADLSEIIENDKENSAKYIKARALARNTSRNFQICLTYLKMI